MCWRQYMYIVHVVVYLVSTVPTIVRFQSENYEIYREYILLIVVTMYLSVCDN